MKRKLPLFLFALLFGVSFVSAPSTATAFLFTGQNTSLGLSASADFVQSGNNLILTLTNISTNDVMNPSQVLTAVFFDIVGVGTLTPISALLNGSTVYFGPDGGGNVGGEWAYASGLIGAPGGATEGISSTGLGLFGNYNFGGTSLQPPDALNGLNYGITSAGDNLSTGNKPVTGGSRGDPVALIENSVVFTLSGLAGITLTEGMFQHVSFQYGTSLSEPNVPVPEPATMMLLGSGLIGLAAFGRKSFLKR